jgi:hypothetical protein
MVTDEDVTDNNLIIPSIYVSNLYYFQKIQIIDGYIYL